MKAGLRTNKLKKGNSYTVFVDYGIVNGSRKREPLETFSTKGDAQKYQAKVQSQIDNNTFINVPNITFSQAIDEWMENYVANNCELNTADGYKLNNDKYLKPLLGHIPLKIIGGISGIDIINDYYKHLRFELDGKTDPKTNKKLKNLSYSTLKHHKAQISGIFTYFVKCKKLQSNICLNTTIPKSENEKMLDTVIDDIENYENNIDDFKEKNFITPEQAITVLNLFMNTSMMLPVALAMFLGMRRSEICGALKDNFNKTIPSLIINSTRVRCSKGTLFKKRNKNKTSSRELYLPLLLLQVIELDEKRQEKNRLIYGDNYCESKFLCVNDMGKPISIDYVSHKFTITLNKFIQNETIRAKANGTSFSFPKITFHSLRHLNITALLKYGAELVDVKDNAGHSDIHTTLGYTHQYTQNKQEIANKIDEVFMPYFTLKK